MSWWFIAYSLPEFPRSGQIWELLKEGKKTKGRKTEKFYCKPCVFFMKTIFFYKDGNYFNVASIVYLTKGGVPKYQKTDRKIECD